MSNPLREHEEFVESLVKCTPSVSARLVHEEGVYSRAEHSPEVNALVDRLPDGDRDLLARMLQAERRSAIFDVLVQLHEMCAVKGWKLSKGALDIPHEPYGYTMFEEYVTLLEDERGWLALR